MFRKITPKFTFFLTLFLMIALAGTAMVKAAVSTDKGDYLPGSVVTISGDNTDNAGYQPGETVNVNVAGPNGYTAACDAVVSDTGAWSCQVTLWADAKAIGDYTYTATGATSKVSQSGTFSDGNVDFTGTVKDNKGIAIVGATVSCTTGCNKLSSTTTGAGGVYSLKVNFAGDSGLINLTASMAGYTNTTFDQLSLTNGSNQTQNFILNPMQVIKTDQTITFAALAGKTFGDAPFTVSATASSGLAVSFAAAGNCSVAGNIVTITGAGSCTITASQAGDATYNAAPDVPQTFAIAKVTPVITWANPADIVYGTALGAAQLNATASVPGAFVYSPAAGIALDAGAGQTLSVTFTPTDTANYNTVTKSVTINVNKAAQTITFGALSGKTYGDPDFSVSASVSSSQLPIFTASGSCTVNGSSVHLTGAGSCTITASAGESNNYNSATPISQTFTIGARPITVASDAQTKTYGDNDPAFTYQITSGSLVNSDGFTGSLTRVAGEDVGTYAITQGTLALSSNYTLTFAGTNLTITPRPVTVTANAQTKVYGDTDPAFSYKVTSGSLLNGDSVTGALARVAGENVGIYAINQGTLALSNNYALTFAGANLSITPRALNVTADALTKVYGDADPALTYKITGGGLVGTDPFSGSLTRVQGETVGTYAITQGTLVLNTNYALTFVGANLTITARPVTVTANGQTKVYGDTDPALTYNITNGNLVGTDAFSGSMTREPGETVGTYAITQGTLALDSNYALTFTGANLSITARLLTITADAKTKFYGDTDPALTYKVTTGSLAFSDAFTGSLTRDAGENVGTYALQQGTLALNTNYALTFVGADLTITARPITVTAIPQSKVYGDPDPKLTYQITDGSLAFKDDFIGTLARASGEDVATYLINQGTLALDTNYTLTFKGANLTITIRPITVTADAQTKVYGDNDPALTYKISGGSLAFSDAFTGSLTRDAGETVGTYAINQGTLALSSNYSLTFAGADLTITTRPVTITAYPQTKVYGAIDPQLTYHITVGTVVSGDKFTGDLARVAGEDVGTYPITNVTVSLGTNYALTFVGANLTITARPITVTADSFTKILGKADPAFTFTVTGTLVGTDTFSGALTRVPGETVGAYNITQGTLELTSNYALNFVGGTLKIVYDFPGFLQPINDTAHERVCGKNCTLSVFKAGSTVPVKFQIFDGSGKPVKAAVDPIWMKPINGATIAVAIDEVANYDAPTTGNTFRWDASSQQYIYNWSTKGLKAGIYYIIGATLDDGTQHVVIIGLR